ncbi:MAG: hypothetical protein JSS42_14210 [Proteobacteria bacterium]|nr:hypothetical protein [Pseudomonadota bacterium]
MSKLSHDGRQLRRRVIAEAKAAFIRSHRLSGIMYREQDEDPTGELPDVLINGPHEAPAKP